MFYSARVMVEATRVAVVTGGESALGSEIARQLSERGLKIVLVSNDEARGAAAATKLAAGAGDVVFQHADVTNPGSVAELRRYIESTVGRLDVLVNAGGASPDEGDETTSFFDVDPQRVRLSFERSTLAALHCCQALIPLMRIHDYGRVVNLSLSTSALRAGWTGRGIGVAGVNAVTRLLGAELAGSNIKVNSACPGDTSAQTGGHSAESLTEGVDTVVWLATLRDDGPSGGFYRDCKAISW